MTRQLKSEHLLMLDRPFCIWVEPDTDGAWIATIAGHGLDNITFDYHPADAVAMAADLLRMLTGRCRPHDDTSHDWSIDIKDTEIDTPFPAWKCSRCGEVALKSDIEEVEDDQ